MGERIKITLDIIRLVRHSEIRYSFEHMVVNLLLGVACIIFSILGEPWLWLLFLSVLFISVGAQGLRVRHYMRRKERERRDAAAGDGGDADA